MGWCGGIVKPEGAAYGHVLELVNCAIHDCTHDSDEGCNDCCECDDCYVQEVTVAEYLNDM